jgi:bacteriocin-like protein
MRRRNMTKQHIVKAAAEVMTDEELAAVVGGMTCEGAKALAQVYAAVGDTINAAGGSPQDAGAYYGRALGVLQGACS